MQGTKQLIRYRPSMQVKQVFGLGLSAALFLKKNMQYQKRQNRDDRLQTP